MDPNATFTTMMDFATDDAERYEAAENLLSWLAAGGFPPAAFPGTRGALAAQCLTIMRHCNPKPRFVGVYPELIG